MDEQTLALLQFLLSGGGLGGSTQFNQFAGNNPQETGNESIARAVGGFSPVNQNPGYGGTVSRFFNQNPLAGSQPFTGANPLQPGSAGQNSSRAFTGHSSFLPNNFGSSMQQWT